MGLPKPHSLDKLGSHATVFVFLHLCPVWEQECHQMPTVVWPPIVFLWGKLSATSSLGEALTKSPASRD